jgi:hypothetical protein
MQDNAKRKKADKKRGRSDPARRDKEVFCINFAAPKMKTPASGLMKK